MMLRHPSQSGHADVEMKNAEGGDGSEHGKKRKKEWWDRDATVNAQRRGLRNAVNVLRGQLQSTASQLQGQISQVSRLASSEQKLLLGEVLCWGSGFWANMFGRSANPEQANFNFDCRIKVCRFGQGVCVCVLVERSSLQVRVGETRLKAVELVLANDEGALPGHC